MLLKEKLELARSPFPFISVWLSSKISNFPLKNSFSSSNSLASFTLQSLNTNTSLGGTISGRENEEKEEKRVSKYKMGVTELSTFS